MFHEAMGCPNGNCIPGRQACEPPCEDPHTFVGAFCQNLYQCLCCPDPCYQPTWVPAANASFFADYARPRTVTRLRYDNLEAMTRPDRNQFWINGVVGPATRKNGVRINNPQARLQQIYMYQEVAAGRGSFFVEYPYRQINENYQPTQAGFSDINFGIKSLLFDCEMLQVTFQFRTYTPSGNAANNLGTGHFSLDPSILTSLKLGPTTYFQGQFGNWIPLGGQQYRRGRRLLLADEPQPGPLVRQARQPADRHARDGRLVVRERRLHRGHPAGQDAAVCREGRRCDLLQHRPGPPPVGLQRLDFGGAITWATGTAALGPALVPLRGPVPVLMSKPRGPGRNSARQLPRGNGKEFASNADRGLSTLSALSFCDRLVSIIAQAADWER